jgi:hypothetical protein
VKRVVKDPFRPPVSVFATSAPRCTQADQINIMVTKRVSWYKRFTFESSQRGVPTLRELQRQWGNAYGGQYT